MSKYHWDHFYLHLYYQVEPSEVFSAWTTAKGLSSFFVKESLIKRDESPLSQNSLIEEGDSFEFLWDDNSKTMGNFLEVNQKNLTTTFSFGESSKIRIKINKDPKGTLLELKHYDISGTVEDQQRYQLDCRVGWTYYMTNLRSVLENNSDLRDQNPDCAGTLCWGIYPPRELHLD